MGTPPTMRRNNRTLIPDHRSSNRYGGTSAALNGRVRSASCERTSGTSREVTMNNYLKKMNTH